ncbi:Transcription factor GTE10 [Bienertia sinuspersici]
MGSVSEVSTIVTENAITSKKPRLKILVKKPANGACQVSEVPAANCIKKVASTDGGSKEETSNKVNCIKKAPSTDGGSGINADTYEKKLKSTLGTKHVIGGCQPTKQVPEVNCLEKSSVTHNLTTTTSICNKKLHPMAGYKHRSEEVLGNHERKRLKMDSSATLLCHNILKQLMNLKQSVPFHTPVKPELWGLDDYFDIIKKPMDLGTIKQKLLQNKLLGTDQFEADVRLTFSNAMLYNPPGNWCHESAKELLRVFERLWKPVKMKLDKDHRDIKHKGSEISHRKTVVGVKDEDPEHVSVYHNQLPGKSLPRLAKSSEDWKLSVERQDRKRRDIKLKGFESNKLVCDVEHNDLESMADHFNPFPEKTLPRRAKSFEDLNKLSREAQHSGLKTVGGRSTSTSQGASYGQGSVGEYHGLASCPTISDLELSPSKALRVAKLMDRYSETILKAQNHTLLEQGGGTNSATWQTEKMLLQMRQREEKARICEQIKAVKSAARLKTESELKKQRQVEREAARMAIQTMEQSVFVDDNLQVLRDLEAMIGRPLVVMCHGDRSRANSVWSQMKSDKFKSPLERLGLYIKEEYQVGNEDDYVISMNDDFEEGEVIESF